MSRCPLRFTQGLRACKGPEFVLSAHEDPWIARTGHRQSRWSSSASRSKETCRHTLSAWLLNVSERALATFS